jgi:8-oxo-dGTP pyrophosphatase MutT (NUDIX family)
MIVSFPGGRVDQVSTLKHTTLIFALDPACILQADVSFLDTALRETREEVGLPAAQIDILGQFGPAEQSLKGMRVWPYVVRSNLTPV